MSGAAPITGAAELLSELWAPLVLMCLMSRDALTQVTCLHNDVTSRCDDAEDGSHMSNDDAFPDNDVDVTDA